MPRYLITRTVPALTEEQIAAAGKLSKAVTEELGIKWIKTYYSEKEGKFYCEYEAPNVDLIYEHGRRAQLPVDSVSMISGEFDPSMFK
jgi:Nickel responsive protein SCO4226-like